MHSLTHEHTHALTHSCTNIHLTHQISVLSRPGMHIHLHFNTHLYLSSCVIVLFFVLFYLCVLFSFGVRVQSIGVKVLRTERLKYVLQWGGFGHSGCGVHPLPFQLPLGTPLPPTLTLPSFFQLTILPLIGPPLAFMNKPFIFYYTHTHTHTHTSTHTHSLTQAQTFTSHTK